MLSESLKNFLKGMGSAVEIFPPSLKDPMENTSDKERLASDWQRVSEDLHWAIGEVNDRRKN